MKVFIVLNGERGEGSIVCGVYRTKEKAIKEAMKITPHFGEWIRNGEELYWESGCDYIKIEKHEIK